MIDVLTLGEVLGSFRSARPLQAGGTVTVTVAGAEANVAVGLSRLGHTASWIGVVGNDGLGRLALRTLRGEGVLTDQVRVDPVRQTGALLLEQTIADIARVTYLRSGSAGSQLQRSDVVAAVHKRPRWLHVTGITLAISESARDAVFAAVEAASQVGTKVCLDVNHRRSLWSETDAALTLRKLLPLVDVLIGSPDEVCLTASLTEAAVEGPTHPSTDAAVTFALEECGVSDVVVKRGAAGASLHTTDGQWEREARRVPVRDSVGAGDAFTAGYLSGLLDGLTHEDRLDRGIVCGAFAVATEGDWEGLPTRADLTLLDVQAGTTQR